MYVCMYTTYRLAFKHLGEREAKRETSNMH